MLETDSLNQPTVSYVLGGAQILSQTKYVYNSPESVSTVTRYLLPDGQGSTRLLTKPNGDAAASQAFEYSAFGDLLSTEAPDTNYLYTGQQYDAATDLYSLRARYYDPGVGRFLSRDTWAYDFQNPVELNRYVYAMGNPVNYADPSGYMAAESLALDLNSRQSSPGVMAIGLFARQRFIKIAVIALLALIAADAIDDLLEQEQEIDVWDDYDLWEEVYRILRDRKISPQLKRRFPFPLPPLLPKPGESEDIVYRNPSIDPPQHPGALLIGFFAKNPNATWTVEGHVRNASKKGRNSQYISVTRSLDVALRRKASPPIYVIDLNQVIGLKIDLTIESVRLQHLKSTISQNYAEDAQEVLIVGWIPPWAIKGLIP